MCRGRTVALYIHGPSGVGKTALVRHFLDDSDRPRPRPSSWRAGATSRSRSPTRRSDSVVDALSRYLKRLPLAEAQALLPRDIRSLVRVFPALREAEAVATAPRLAAVVPDPQELRRRAFRALRELLARLGDRRPLVLAIDDLQWGDSDSAALLSELLRPPDAPRLLLLGCYRSEDAADEPAPAGPPQRPAKAAGPGVDRRELALGPLEPADAEGLAPDPARPRGRGRPAPTPRPSPASRGVTRSSSPSSRDTSRPMPGSRIEGGRPIEVALDEVLWARVRRLPEDGPAPPGGRRRLGPAARPGGGVPGRRAGRRRAERHFALLRSGRLIRSTGPAERDEIETYHDRVREAVIAHIPPSDLEDHHRRLAQVLESSGRADPEVLAVHFHGARQLERAGTYYAQAAAQAAEALAFDRAAKLYRLALELRPGGRRPRPRRLRMGLADALANAGRGPEAAREYLAAAAGATVAESFELPATRRHAVPDPAATSTRASPS